MTKISHMTAKSLGQNLVSAMQNKFDNIEMQTAPTLATLLDLRFKMIGFYNQGVVSEAFAIFSVSFSVC